MNLNYALRAYLYWSVSVTEHRVCRQQSRGRRRAFVIANDVLHSSKAAASSSLLNRIRTRTHPAASTGEHGWVCLPDERENTREFVRNPIAAFHRGQGRND